jgi:hypothetical protein
MTDARELDALIDGALAEDASIAPSAGFPEAVMREIRRAARPPLPFPWRRVAGGLCLAGAAAALAIASPDGAAAPLPSPAVIAPLATLALAVPYALLSWRAARRAPGRKADTGRPTAA